MANANANAPAPVPVRPPALTAFKIHGMPKELWWRVRSAAALAGMTASNYTIAALKRALERDEK